MIEINSLSFPFLVRCNKNNLLCHYSLSSEEKLNLDISNFILDFFYDFDEKKISLKDGVFRCKFAIFLDLSFFQYTFFLFPFFRYFQKIPNIGQEKLILK